MSLDCYPGAWIAVNPTNLVMPAANGIEVTNLIQIANAGYATTKALIVGNEVLYAEKYENPNTTPQRQGVILTNLLNYIQQVKAATGLPVATAEPYLIWTNDQFATLRSAVDYCVMHVHPYWNGVPVTGAAQFVMGIYYDTKRVFPTKQVIIGETGWPTEGHIFSRAVPGVENQLHFLRDFRAMADAHGIDYFWFEVFDEAWKYDGSVGPHWGIMNTDRSWKSPFNQLMAEESGFMSPGMTAGMPRWNLQTYAQSLYQLQYSDNLKSGVWSNLQVIAGSAGTNTTSVVFTNGAPTARFIRMMPSP